MVVRAAAMFLIGTLVLPAARPAPDALKGVWLSIESPVNPYDNANQGIFLMVHTFWMHGPAAMTVEGRAEGTVDGERKTMTLAFQDRGDGVYALPQSWPKDGRWALVITGRSRGQQATALVRIGDDYKVAGVLVTPDKTIADADVVAALR
jgi:hypothetical protein